MTEIRNAHSSLLVFADDWGRHPSSCQHLVKHLLAKHPVFWVNTIGTRKPKFDLMTLKRGLGKFRQWLGRSASEAKMLPKNLTLLSPKMWPAFSNRLDRWLNQKLLMRSLRRLVDSQSEPPIAITTLPIVADLMELLHVKRWVYFCVDDFSKWPGLDGKTLGKLERIVVEKAERIICVSEHLQERLQKMGRESHLLTHGVDLEFWQQKSDEDFPELTNLPRPLIVFWGVLDRRMDLNFVGQLARDLQQGTILLVGPENEPDPNLFALPRVRKLGAIPFSHLPALARQSDVLIMPYADLPVTRAMQPLKLKEYLATGKPCIVSDLPANREWADCLDLASSPLQFSEQVRQRLTSGLPDSQRRERERLQSESWSSKAGDFEKYISHG